MSSQIIGLQEWLQTPPGRYLLDWEQAQLNEAVADIFGFHALQLGLPALDGLGANRMPHRWLATQTVHPGAALVTDFSALPFAQHSLDLVVLPHALELAADPHSTLREVERVLLPEGRVVICGFNPASLWGLRQRSSHLYQRFGWGTPFLPATELLGYWRLRDWLRLLGFEVEVVRFGAYRPAFMSEKWLHRLRWLDALGARWWPILGAAYFLVAVKRVPSMTLLSPAWKAAKQRANARVLVANHSTLTGTSDLNHQKTRSTD